MDHKAPTLANPENAIYFDERLSGFWANKKLENINQANFREYHEYANLQFKKFQIDNKSKRVMTS